MKRFIKQSCAICLFFITLLGGATSLQAQSSTVDPECNPYVNPYYYPYCYPFAYYPEYNSATDNDN